MSLDLLGNKNIRETISITFIAFKKFFSRKDSKKKSEEERVINCLGFVDEVIPELSCVGQ